MYFYDSRGKGKYDILINGTNANETVKNIKSVHEKTFMIK